MLTLDILICTLNARVARVTDILLPPTPEIRYVVSLQYTDENYLNAIPQQLREREDVTIVTLKGEGLSANRNNALKFATSDLVYLVDDDVHLLPSTYGTITHVFERYPESIDIALFEAQSYAGKPLRDYYANEGPCNKLSDLRHVLTIEMVCKRERVHGNIEFDNRFGLGSHYLSCYEEQVFLYQALNKGLRLCYIAQPIVRTSAIYVPRMIYIDGKVQRSFGALLYYAYGRRAYWKAFMRAAEIAGKRYAHFLPVLRHFMEGIAYIKRKNT